MPKTTRRTTLQEKLLSTANDAELMNRPIVGPSRLIYEKRSNKITIRSRHEIQTLILLQKMHPSKIEDYDRYPYASQLGLIPAIAEQDFDLSTATIIDLCFLGLFPKGMYQVLRRYELEIKRFNSSEDATFRQLFNNLILAIIYRPIMVQNVIHILLANHKRILQENMKCLEEISHITDTEKYV